jgi:hypothetical protein
MLGANQCQQQVVGGGNPKKDDKKRGYTGVSIVKDYEE